MHLGLGSRYPYNPLKVPKFETNKIKFEAMASYKRPSEALSQVAEVAGFGRFLGASFLQSFFLVLRREWGNGL